MLESPMLNTVKEDLSDHGQSEQRQGPAMIPNSVLFNRKSASSFAPQCPLSSAEDGDIDYKNLELLGRYITPAGRIIPGRITSVSASKRRLLKNAIKRARMVALLPFSNR